MSEDLEHLQKLLANKRTKLRLIEERRSQYVLSIDIPLQLVSEERELTTEIKELEDRIARQQSSATTPSTSTGVLGGAAPAAAKQPRTPSAFMSYAEHDQQHDNTLTTLRDRLSQEVRSYTGSPFPIYSRDDKEWGQTDEAVKRSLEGVTFMIPVITPSFFNDPKCRWELALFREREQQLGLNDLILPIYYIKFPPYEQGQGTDASVNEMLQQIAGHHLMDWRDLRTESFSSSRVRRMLQQMAEQITNALQRS